MNIMNYKKVKEELVQRDGLRCSACGKMLSDEVLVIDHIFPRSIGGTDDLNNLQLICSTCNIKKINKLLPSLEQEFIEYIKSLLEAHSEYNIIESSNDGCELDIDIIFERKNGKNDNVYIAEVKTATTYTDVRINQIIKWLDVVKTRYSHANKVFIFPGQVSEKYKLRMQKEGIEVWDIEFLVREFSQQIKEIQHPVFSSVIRLIYNNLNNDKFLKKIFELKNCLSGREHWGKYQKLIGEIINIIFGDDLNVPIPQSKDEYHKNRRDYIMPNYAKEGIWKSIREQYKGDFVVIDAKNSGKKIQKDDVLQMGHYLKEEGLGLFGIIISRKGVGGPARYALRELWIHDKKMIIVLDDVDIEEMLLTKKNSGQPEVLIRKKIEDFRLSI